MPKGSCKLSIPPYSIRNRHFIRVYTMFFFRWACKITSDSNRQGLRKEKTTFFFEIGSQTLMYIYMWLYMCTFPWNAIWAVFFVLDFPNYWFHFLIKCQIGGGRFPKSGLTPPFLICLCISKTAGGCHNVILYIQGNPWKWQHPG